MSYFNHELFPILLEHLPPIQSSKLREFIANDDVLGLVTQSVDRSKPLDFDDVFFKEFFRKVSDAPLGIDTAEVAVSGFRQIESHNVSSNLKIKMIKDFCIANPGSDIAIALRRIRTQIRLIIGSGPKQIKPNITFGATVNLKANNNIFDRFNKPTVTQDCLDYLRQCGEIREEYNYSSWPRSNRVDAYSCSFPRSFNRPSPFGAEYDDFVINNHCALSTVGKTAQTDRVITKDNVVNLAYQSGAGQEIRSHLKRFGLDITTSQQFHKTLAKFGSLLGNLATGDLTSASDMIVKLLVELFLPAEWFRYLDALRSKHVEYNGSISELQMFSSAGNGFTFELETLIFYSIALCASNAKSNKGVYLKAPPLISVYGDDIILPVEHFNNLKQLLDAFGFILNTRKSFSTGGFRESCGGDYYLGIDMRGYNAKALPKEPREWFSIINALRRVCYYNYGSTWRDDWCFNLWIGLIHALPKEHQLYGPSHYGDLCINTEQQSLYALRNKNRRASEEIKILGTTGGDFTTVGRAIATNRTCSGVAARLVCHASVKDHGFKHVKKDDSNFGSFYEGKFKVHYPETIVSSIVGINYQPTWTQYTLSGQAPEDIDELVLFLNSENASFLRHPRSAGAYNALVLHRNRQKLAIALANVKQLKIANAKTVMTELMSFTFS